MDDFDYLDEIARLFRVGDEESALRKFGLLSTGEALYVALAANRCDLLGNHSIAYAIDRLGDDWVQELVVRHRFDHQPLK